MSGWVKIHRRVLDHWASQEPEFLAVWVRILMEANHSDKKQMINGSLVTVKRGSLVYGRNAFSERSGVTVNKLRRIITTLESEGMIHQQNTNKYSIISIANYSKFQDLHQQSTSKNSETGEKSTEKAPANNQDNKYINQQVTRGSDSETTSKAPAEHQQTTTPKECKEVKESNRRFAPPSHQEVTDYFFEKGLDDSQEAHRFINYHAQANWMLSRGRKMVDWKAAARTWLGNQEKWQK